jgi:hypothetical protein
VLELINWSIDFGQKCCRDQVHVTSNTSDRIFFRQVRILNAGNVKRRMLIGQIQIAVLSSSPVWDDSAFVGTNSNAAFIKAILFIPG